MNFLKSAVAVSALVLCMVHGEVHAASASGGVLTEPSRMREGERTVLLRELAAARAAHPDAFKGLAELRASLPEADAHKRGRLATMTPALKAVGRMSIHPLLEELAVNAEPRGELTQTAWLAWRVGLLEATGSMRDPRAAPVLFAILDGPATDFLVMKAAAEAVAKLETDAAASKLIALSRTAGARRDAAVAGMGHCRRMEVVDRLVEVLGSTSDRALAAHAVKSLAAAGNAWVWEMPAMASLAASQDGQRLRLSAAQALVGAYLRFDAELREAALRGVLVVDHPQTGRLIAEARKSSNSDEQRAALDQLALRFAQSPLRRAR